MACETVNKKRFVDDDDKKNHDTIPGTSKTRVCETMNAYKIAF
jgi:hypothetical protein